MTVLTEPAVESTVVRWVCDAVQSPLISLASGFLEMKKWTVLKPAIEGVRQIVNCKI